MIRLACCLTINSSRCLFGQLFGLLLDRSIVGCLVIHFTSVRRSITRFFDSAKTRVFDFGRWIGVRDGERRVMGGDDEGRATREEASKDMPRGTHLTAVYPALLVKEL